MGFGPKFAFLFIKVDIIEGYPAFFLFSFVFFLFGNGTWGVNLMGGG